MSRDDAHHSELSEDFADPREDQLLRALAAAPHPDAAALARVLPELADTLESEPSDAPALGTLIEGRYRLTHVLGRGGMGVVFEAEQLATGRKVALKWVRSRALFGVNPAEDGAFLRFVREAQVAGRIRHPNVVDVYDAGVHPSAPYLVMEKLEGETLRARIERGPMGWDEALAIVLPVMDGVRAAHEKGVIHRDIKPDNIFLTHDAAGQLVPKVLDFGISRLHGSESVEASLTRTGATVGTPAYMPLEQLCGTGSDERTDVYALGVVLYELLLGERPYTARNAADFAVVMASRPAVAPSKLRAELAGPREAVLMKALEREASARHASVQAFASALRAAAPRASGRARVGWLVAALVLVGLGVVWLSLVGEPTSSVAAPQPRGLIPPEDPAPQVPDKAPEMVSTPPPSTEPSASAPERDPSERPSVRKKRPQPGPASASPTALRKDDFLGTEPPRRAPARAITPNEVPPDMGRSDF